MFCSRNLAIFTLLDMSQYNISMSLHITSTKQTLIAFSSWLSHYNYTMPRKYSNSLQLGFSIPGSRPIFSIPNPGIGDALILGFRDYKNCKLHADKVKFGAYFCHNFVEFVAYILRCYVFSFIRPITFTIRTASCMPYTIRSLQYVC